MRFIARHRRFFNWIIAFLCILAFCYFAFLTIIGNGGDVQSQVSSGMAMGTAVKKTIYSIDTSLFNEVDVLIDDTLKEFEAQTSVRLKDSEVSKINRMYVVGGTTKASDNLLAYLKLEMEVWHETDGAFSPCIYPVTSLWGIEDGNENVPDDKKLQERILLSDANNIELTEDGIIFKEADMSIDLGAAGKGAACDAVREKLMETGIQGAVVSIGGSILAYGDKGDGKDWHIGIQNPRGKIGDVFGIIDTEGNCVVSTSGDYEKYFELDGKRYHHIIDPVTGYPADNGLISVSVVCESGILSDVLSTACFVLGLEEGMQYAEEKGVGAVFVTSDKEVFVTKNLKKKFRLQSDEYTVVK